MLLPAWEIADNVWIVDETAECIAFRIYIDGAPDHVFLRLKMRNSW
jgi:hypothetical protein